MAEDSIDGVAPSEEPTGCLGIDDNPYQFQDDENPLVLLKRQHEKIAENESHVTGETQLSAQYRRGELADMEETVTCKEALLKGIDGFLGSLIQTSEILTEAMGDVSKSLLQRLEKECPDFVPGKVLMNDSKTKALGSTSRKRRVKSMYNQSW